MTCRNPYVVTEPYGADKFFAHCLTCCGASEPTSHKPRLEDLEEGAHHGRCGMSEHSVEPEFFTAEEIRALAEQMEWLETGQIKEAVICVEQYDRPWAWIHVHPDNGPRAQVTFDPAFIRSRVLPPADGHTPGGAA